MQRDVEKVEELYRAFEKRDVKSILMQMSKEVEVVQSSELPWGGTFSGHEGVRQFLAALGENIQSRVQIERLIDAGENVVAVGRTVGKSIAAGLEFDIPVVHVWTFQDGQVVRFQPMIENATMLAALGG
jgi:ketosteroid isomerase-like protein